MKRKPRFRLRNLGFDEVSVVVSGDDPGADILIAKSDKTHDHDRTRHTMGDMTEEASVPNEISKDELPDEVRAYIDELEGTVADQNETIEESNKLLEEAAAALEADLDDESEDEVDEAVGVDTPELVLAKADPAVRELVEKAEEAKAEAIAKAEEAQSELARRDYVSKAQAFPMISTDTDRLGEILKAVDDHLDPEMAGELVELLTKANATITETNVFGEMGTNIAKTAPKLEAAVEEIRKEDPDLTYEAAMATALDRNPDLYDDEES